MNYLKDGSGLLTKGIPTFLGIGIAWIGFKIIKNEKRLILRRMELEDRLIKLSIKK